MDFLRFLEKSLILKPDFIQKRSYSTTATTTKIAFVNCVKIPAKLSSLSCIIALM